LAEEKLFHESWYRLAGQRVGLRPGVRTQRQLFRGEKWYILRDPFGNQFYRMRPGAYSFVARLGSKRTVEEVWKETMALDPDGAPGQGEVIELLAQLYHANLLYYDLPPDSVKLFERYQKKKQRILMSNLMNIMFLRIPLFDPDPYLKRILPWINRIMSPAGAVVWLLVVGAGLKAAVESFGELRLQSEGVLAPSNLFLLYSAAVLIKALHEFGHAFAVRRFGGEVHTMGVMFLIFSPLPYTDASAAWSFREKRKRIFVGAAGMIVEVFVASIALLVWAHTGPGTLHALTYNMIFIASVSTILFNINPLLRYDGYYILSDLVDVPNLHQRAMQHMTYLVERHAFGCRDGETPAETRKEAIWLTVFGLLSGVYRVFVFSRILLFIADRFLLLGLIMAAVCAVAWVVVPSVKFVRYLAENPRLYKTRPRAIAVCSSAFAAAVLLFAVIPMPASFKAPGVLKAEHYVVAANNTAGVVEELVAPSGRPVHPGDTLLRMSNVELALQIRQSQAGLDEAVARRQKAMQERQADVAPLESRVDYYSKRLSRLNKEKEDLTMKSDMAAMWVSPGAEDYLGMWVPRGTPLGQLVNGDSFYFASVVSQQDVSELFSGKQRKAEVKLYGQAEVAIPVSRYVAIPMEQTKLPSAALGWGAGGDVPVDAQDAHGMKTAEPFYEVRAFVTGDTKAALLHGRSGKIKFRTAARPLLQQGWRRLRQLVQKRYQV